MDKLYFLVRFTPFWGIPLLVLCLQMGVVMWRRSKKKLAIYFFLSSLILIGLLSYYFWLGGPIRAADQLERGSHWLVQ